MGWVISGALVCCSGAVRKLKDDVKCFYALHECSDKRLICCRVDDWGVAVVRWQSRAYSAFTNPSNMRCRMISSFCPVLANAFTYSREAGSCCAAEHANLSARVSCWIFCVAYCLRAAKLLASHNHDADTSTNF